MNEKHQALVFYVPQVFCACTRQQGSAMNHFVLVNAAAKRIDCVSASDWLARLACKSLSCVRVRRACDHRGRRVIPRKIHCLIIECRECERNQCRSPGLRTRRECQAVVRNQARRPA
ncbi:hypothetical protein CCHR01_17604 [Colletotrichum chrysophilum]|uniref:Uncharacterized protein n=1 Tax=Colletotrichum chrysophilum TaxID=1836956 RepID=A0AAD9A435_9PEZI|nr:hypothetical protein CCHR01_17604 [Colletotrichum chrysophilum]